MKKNNVLFYIIFFILGVFFNSLTIYAVTKINSLEVSYDSSESVGTKNNVKESLDELYDIAEEYKNKCGDYGYVAEEIDATHKKHDHVDTCYRIKYTYTTEVHDPCPGNKGYQDWQKPAEGYKYQYTCNACGAWVGSPGQAHTKPQGRQVEGSGYSMPSGATFKSSKKELNCSKEYEGYTCPSGYVLYQNNKCYRCPKGGDLYGKVCVLE